MSTPATITHPAISPPPPPLLLLLLSGKLTTDQIKLGYAALKKIEECITRGDFGDKLVQACDQFYTRIPHSFG